MFKKLNFSFVLLLSLFLLSIASSQAAQSSVDFSIGGSTSKPAFSDPAPRRADARHPRSGGGEGWPSTPKQYISAEALAKLDQEDKKQKQEISLAQLELAAESKAELKYSKSITIDEKNKPCEIAQSLEKHVNRWVGPADKAQKFIAYIIKQSELELNATKLKAEGLATASIKVEQTIIPEDVKTKTPAQAMVKLTTTKVKNNPSQLTQLEYQTQAEASPNLSTFTATEFPVTVEKAANDEPKETIALAANPELGTRMHRIDLRPIAGPTPVKASPSPDATPTPATDSTENLSVSQPAKLAEQQSPTPQTINAAARSEVKSAATPAVVVEAPATKATHPGMAAVQMGLPSAEKTECARKESELVAKLAMERHERNPVDTAESKSYFSRTLSKTGKAAAKVGKFTAETGRKAFVGAASNVAATLAGDMAQAGFEYFFGKVQTPTIGQTFEPPQPAQFCPNPCSRYRASPFDSYCSNPCFQCQHDPCKQFCSNPCFQYPSNPFGCRTQKPPKAEQFLPDDRHARDEAPSVERRVRPRIEAPEPILDESLALHEDSQSSASSSSSSSSSSSAHKGFDTSPRFTSQYQAEIGQHIGQLNEKISRFSREYPTNREIKGNCYIADNVNRLADLCNRANLPEHACAWHNIATKIFEASHRIMEADQRLHQYRFAAVRGFGRGLLNLVRAPFGLGQMVTSGELEKSISNLSLALADEAIRLYNNPKYIVDDGAKFASAANAHIQKSLSEFAALPMEQRIEKAATLLTELCLPMCAPAEFARASLLATGLAPADIKAISTLAQSFIDLAKAQYVLATMKVKEKIKPFLGQACIDAAKVVGVATAEGAGITQRALDIVEANPQLLEQGATLAQAVEEVAKEVCSPTGTVWDCIKMTDPMYERTRIPKSFELKLKNQKVWVHPNATEHMKEYIEKCKGHGMPMNSQSLLKSFAAAIEKSVENGIRYTADPIVIDNWKILFGAPREEGLLPVVRHALYQP